MAQDGGTLHGVRVSRGAARGGGGDRTADNVLIRRISVRYDDGTVAFIPEARERFFSQDDAHRVAGMLRQSSETLEWGLTPEGDPEPEQGSGSA